MLRALLLLSLLAALPASGRAPPPPPLDTKTARALARGEVEVMDFHWFVAPPPKPGAPALLAAGVSVGGKGSPTRSFQVQTCAQLYEQIRSHGRPRQLGAEPFAVQIDFGRIRLGDQTLFDEARTACQEGSEEIDAAYLSRRDEETDGEAAGDAGEPALPEGQVCAGERCSTDYKTRQYRLLSLVGPIASLDERRSEAGGGGPPYHGQDWLSFDLRTGKPAHPLDLVEETSLEQALRADPVVRERLGEELGALGSAREILTRLLGKRGVQGFAFHAYDRKKERVALRLAFHRELAGMLPNEVSQLGLWVKPRAEARAFFEQAAAGKGLLLSTRGVERRLLGAP
jgi:hypothetical protein